MILKHRKAKERGRTNKRGVESFHSFSFGDYSDPRYMGFRSLIALNQATLKAGRGLPAQSSRDMDILYLVQEGTLEHRDGSLGTLEKLKGGQLLCLNTGMGTCHGEANPSKEEPLRLYQIWLDASKRGGKPKKHILSLKELPERGGLRLIASGSGEGGSAFLSGDVQVYFGSIPAGGSMDFSPKTGGGVWIQLVQGQVLVEGKELEEGDGLGVEQAGPLQLKASKLSKILILDL